jgi:hypothetical protein
MVIYSGQTSQLPGDDTALPIVQKAIATMQIKLNTRLGQNH